ncbi:MAG: cob(I)yrinic acid a,c-diamide adenosyltransferase [Pseudanabaenaceae cyanobacterium]
MVAQISRPVVLSTIPTMSTLQVFIAPQRSFYADVLANALRVAGMGSPVLVVQLFQGGSKAGTTEPVELCQHLVWYRCQAQRDLTSPESTITPEELESVQALWALAVAGIKSGEYRLVIIEGLSLAIQRGIVTEQTALELCSQRPTSVDVVLLDQTMPANLLEMADQITKCRS